MTNRRRITQNEFLCRSGEFLHIELGPDDVRVERELSNGWGVSVRKRKRTDPPGLYMVRYPWPGDKMNLYTITS